MISKTENEYEHDVCDSFDDTLTISENIIASRKCDFDDLDSDYIDALRTVSMRVDCPLCHRKKGQLCVSCMNNEPAHKSRMRLIELRSEKASNNLRYVIRSKKWKGDRAVLKINGKWKIVECSDKEWRKLWNIHQGKD